LASRNGHLISHGNHAKRYLDVLKELKTLVEKELSEME
jgi:hypothetical protein